MEFKEPKTFTPEEMAKMQKERALSDAELVQDGAEYVVNENGIRLQVTEGQINKAKKETPANYEATGDSIVSKILEENLDPDTVNEFSKFLGQMPKGLKEDGLKSSILALCMRIKLVENILDENELRIFRQMLSKMSPISEMTQGTLSSSYMEDYSTSYTQTIEIPAEISHKQRFKFLIKLTSMGFDISKKDQFGFDTPLSNMHLELLKEYNDNPK